MDEIEVKDECIDPEYPEWYLENYKMFEQFLSLEQDERNQLVGEASGMFGTILAALTPEGQGSVMSSGKSFLEANIEASGEKFNGMPREILLYLMLGIAIEAIGVQQLKIELAKRGS